MKNKITINKKLFADYAELKDFARALDDKIKASEAKVIENLRSAGLDTLTLPFGTFAVINYKTYQYSTTVTKMHAMLKLAEANERLDGSAKVVKEKEGVRFTRPKNDVE